MNATHIIKKFTTAAFVALAALAARSEYLYWMISQPDPNVENYTAFDYATVKIDGQSGYLSLVDPDDSSAYGTEAVPVDGYSMDEGAYALISGYQELPAGTQFLFELWRDGSDSRVGWARYTKSEVDRFTVNTFNKMAEAPLAVMQPTLVPEPTSGMLLLLGVAGLALRRRRLA